MAIFNKPPTEKPIMRNEPGAPEAGLSVIAPGMKIIGDVESTGVIKVEGTIEGAIRGARQLLLGRQGVIHGNVRTQEAVIGGTIVGTVVADERVEIQGTSSVKGDILTKSIVVLEGGVINGTVRMGDQAMAELGGADRSESKAPQTPRQNIALSQ
ncbi:MAG TPA: polymer-forming cytoskeletal protein [Gemmatimonadaceae bacterium]|jgi:cytoskeletal protein CcmA (bactofilin family)|nr:polymer-forming cytoskeletal protein [Gemmatimonadaceae bacterium]